MNKEEIIELLDKLDRDVWCTDLYETPLTWCELYDIRDYITNLQQENKELKEELQKANDTLDTHSEMIKHLQNRIDGE